MPSTNGATDLEIVQAVLDGTLEVSVLDKAVDRLLTLIFDTQEALGKGRRFTYEEHNEVAIEAALKSIVLLKNENTLPLTDKEEKIGIIGDFAKNPRYQGAGSSLINAIQVDNFLEEFINTGYNVVGYEQGFKRLGGESEKLKNKAVELAKNSDRVILFLGLDEGSEAEGVDRETMCITQNQIELFEEVYKVNQNVVLLLAGGSPIEMPFIDKASAIVHGYLPGQGSGAALTKIVTGEVNPSGKLAESYPLKYSDVSSANNYPGAETTAEHRESIFFGYRHYDTANIDVLFPFGFGLSYTTFEYENLKVEDNKVTVTVKNTGEVAGAEVVQVYVKAKESEVFRAEKELKGFAKVEVEKGESKEATIELDEHAFAYYNIDLNKWVVEDGKYEILVGASSRDIRLSEEITIKGEKINSPYNKETHKAYYDCDVNNMTPEKFEQLLGRKLPDDKWEQGKTLGYSDIIAQAKDAGFFGKALYKVIIWVKKFLRKIGKPLTSNNVMFVLELPFRSIARMSAGKVNNEMLDGILMMVNGNFFKGFVHYIKAYFRYRKSNKA